MKSVSVAGGKLAAVCLVCALCISAVHALTAPVARRNASRELDATLRSLSGGGAVGDERPVEQAFPVRTLYPVRDKAGKIESYIVVLEGKGYGGTLPLMARYAPNGAILAVLLRENQETPGMGKRAEEPGYMKIFIGTGGTRPVPSRMGQLEPEAADGVSGATVTFAGIGKALDAGSRFVGSGGGLR